MTAAARQTDRRRRPRPRHPTARSTPSASTRSARATRSREPALEMGALVNGEAMPDVPVRIPIAMTNRHGLVAGATGTGKTRTLQVLAEQLSAAGVAVFAADIKGDLSGIATPGEGNEKLLKRTEGIGQQWTPRPSPPSTSRSAASAGACRSGRRSRASARCC